MRILITGKNSYIGNSFKNFLKDKPNSFSTNLNTIKSYKFHSKSFLNFNHIISIKYIDEVYTYKNEDDLLELIEFWKPDVIILGEDYIGKNFTGKDLPIKVIYTTRSHEWSTTKIKDLITIQTIKQNPDILKR